MPSCPGEVCANCPLNQAFCQGRFPESLLLATPLFCKDQRDKTGRRYDKEARMMTHTPPGWIEPETVRVRPEAALDLAVVDRFLRPRLPNTDGPLEVVQFAGGHANLTYLLRFGTQEY